jgi:predicted phosphodiesterase
MGFDPAAFEEPTFRGPVQEAPRLVATARSYVEDFNAVRDRIRILSAQVRDLYAVSLTEEVAAGPGRRRILHVSDLHLNPVGVEVIRELVERFEVDAVLDTGDITTFGFPPEGQFGELIEDLALPYYLVPGNHDSDANREALARYPNVTVVDGEVVTIAGVRVLGVAHPVFTADNNTPKAEVDAAVAEQARRTRRLVARTRPDVLAVHDPAQADGSAGEVPLVVAGHLHRRSWKKEDGTLILTVGSTGATGLGVFTVDADLPYEAQILYFDGGQLVAVDNVALRGTRGEFSLDRRLVGTSR